jgi:hypothetical protein
MGAKKTNGSPPRTKQKSKKSANEGDHQRGHEASPQQAPLPTKPTMASAWSSALGVSVDNGGEYYVSAYCEIALISKCEQVAWDGDVTSWVTLSDFEIFTQEKIKTTVAGLKLDHVIGMDVQVDWRGSFNFQFGRVTRKNENGSFHVEYIDGDNDDIQLHKLPKDPYISAYGRTHKVYEWCVIMPEK